MWSDLLKKLSYLSPQDKKFIKKVFLFAQKAHKGQFRASGEPYFVHPLKVAKLLANYKLEKEVISAGLLHDVCEDTSINLNTIKKKFGSNIAFLVDGVSVIGKLQSKADLSSKDKNQKRQLLRLQKLILASAKDIRVIFIRLLDRKHNLETFKVFPRDKQIRKAQETINIYAPIAKKIGMQELGAELEDKAFCFLYPKNYKKVKQLRKRFAPGTIKVLRLVQEKIKKALKANKIKIIKIDFRIKHFFSLYQKLQRYDMDISRIYDLAALRIIVPTKKQCYETLGIIHSIFPPMIGRIKDYIAHPKPNGYQSLHTTVFVKNKKPVEVQIRTLKMHHHAEFGLAAHWFYKEKYSRKDIQNWLKMVNLAISKNYSLKHIFKDEIYVFTPKGKVIELPKGATPLDFAYAIHTEIGHRTRNALVDGKNRPLDYALQNGQIVEIKTTKKEPRVSTLWLDKVKTPEAKSKIRSYLRNQNKEEKIKQAKEQLRKKLLFLGLLSEWKKNEHLILEQFKIRNEEEFFLKLYEGEISLEKLISRFFFKPEKKPIFKSKKIEKVKILVAGKSGVKTKLSNCCQPKPYQEIIGYVSSQNQISIHQTKCPVLSLLDRDRLVLVWWGGEEKKLEILAWDRPGLLKDIASVFADRNLNILSIKSDHPYNNSTKIRVAIECPFMLNLLKIASELEKIPGVKRVFLNK